MNIKQTIITATVALTMVAMIAPMTAGATTVSDLQAQIQALMAQLNTLQGSTATTTTTSVPAACVGVTFTRNLRVGSVGSDVKCLQAILNMSGYQVSATGAGSPGYESMTFGPKTLVAVMKWQAAQGWTPAAQVGPASRAKLNAWLAGATTSTPTTPVTTTTGYPTGCTSNVGYSTTTGQSCTTMVTTVVPTGAGLSVMLSSDNPASGTIVAGQALAALAKYTFANGDNAPVTVTNFTLQRIGISADADLANVYLFNGANRLTDAASVSSGMITFNAPNGLFTIPSGTSMEITVYTDVSGSASAGSTEGVSIPAMTSVVSNASSVKGSFPLSGNLMNVATASLGTFAFSSSQASPQGTPTIQPATNTVVFEENAQVGTRALNLQWLRFRDIGSASYSAFANFRLYINGVQVGSAVPALDSNGYVTFDLTSAPVMMQTGSPDIKVLADIVGGSDRTFQFSVYVAADIRVVDSQYGINVLATNVADAATGTVTLAQGQISIQAQTTSPSGNIVYNSSNQDLGDFTLTASGEPVKITSLNAAVYCSAGLGGTGLRNGALYANGVQVGSTATLACASSTSDTSHYTTFQLGSSLIVNPGSPVTLSVKSDIYATGTQLRANTDSLVAMIVASSAANAQGQTSLQTTFVPTASTVTTGSQLSVVSGGTLTLSKYTAYTNQTTVPNQTKYPLAQFTLTGSTSEAVNLSTINVVLNGAISNASTVVASNLYLTYGSNTTQIIPTPTANAGVNTFSISYQLPAGQTIPITVYGDVSSQATGTGYVTMTITGTTASSGVAATSATLVPGQNITFSTGNFAAAFGNVPSNNQVVSGGQQILVGKYKFTAANDSFTITEMKVQVPSNGSVANSSAIQNAILENDSTNAVIATQPFNTTGAQANDTAYFTGLSIPVPANTIQYVDVYYLLATPNATFSTDQLNVQPELTYVKYLNSSGTVSTTSPNSSGNNIYVFKSIPTFTSQTVNSATASSGTNPELYKFTIAADQKGAISIQQLKFNLTVTHGGASSTPSVNNFTLSRDGTDITSLVTITNSSGTSLTSTTSLNAGSNQAVVVRFNNEEVISAGSSHVYSLRATVNSFLPSQSGNDSVSVSLVGDSSANALANKFIEKSGGSNHIEQLVTSSGGSATDANIIWSDVSANLHTDDNAGTTSGTPTSTGDWANGYLLPGLPLYASSVSAQ